VIVDVADFTERVGVEIAASTWLAGASPPSKSGAVAPVDCG
jgi:hypothetical protein